jgi:nicotinamidase-related amidase
MLAAALLPECQEHTVMTVPHRALILVDVQQEYFAGPLEIQFPPHAESLPQITAAIDAATAAGTPIVVVQHRSGAGAPVFDPEAEGFALHPEIARRVGAGWKHVTKSYGSVFADTDLRDWLRTEQIDTITLVGYMTNNCILASAVEAEGQGVTAEVLADATGAIHLANEAGTVDAETVHTTLMALLNSNYAAVASTDAWIDALAGRMPLAKDNLVQSALAGIERAAQR